MKETCKPTEHCTHCAYYDGFACIKGLMFYEGCDIFQEFKLDDLTIHVSGGEMPEWEQQAYIHRAYHFYGKTLTGISFHVDGDDLDITYQLQNPPFERIRRITGYLVPNLDKWNDGKRAEERSRVKHEGI